MGFLADENFPGPCIAILRKNNVEIKSIAEFSPGIRDEKVMQIAEQEGLTILTHDSDDGELIFKYGHKPVFSRLFDFEPTDPGNILLQ